MAARPRATLADYIVVGISPTLIGLLVGSLVFFLSEVLYQGNYEGRLNFILGLFVMATVCVARISMEEGSAYASMFAAPLALVTIIALNRFVQIPRPLANLSLPINLGFIALIWWCSHKLTWDCTLLDDATDASGQGLLERMGLDGEVAEGTTSVETPAEPVVAQPWWQTWFAPDKRPHTPGVWVIWLSLAALPIFGIGQWFLPAGDLASRRYVFWLMVVYVSCGLGLLLTTSFLSIRKYLRQRRLEMPAEMAAAWLGVGVVLIGVLLVFCFLLPRPNPEYSVTQLPFRFSTPDRGTSQFAVGKDGQKQGPAPQGTKPGQQPVGQPPQSGQPSPGQSANAPGQPPPSNPPAPSNPSQPPGSQGSPQSQGNSPMSSGQQGGQQPSGQQSSPGGNSGKAEGQGGQQAGGQQPGGQSSGKQGESGKSGESNGKASEPQNQQSAGKQSSEPGKSEQKPPEPNDPKNQAPQPNPPPSNSANSQNQAQSPPPAPSQNPQGSTAPRPPEPSPASPPPSSLPSVSTLFGSLGQLLQWLGYAIVALIVAYLAWKYRDELLQAWQKLLAELRELWAKLFGGTVTTAVTQEPAAPPAAPPLPFAAFADPFASGAAKQMQLAQLVRYTFEAVEAWARERNCPRNNGQTPHEFAQYLGQLAPFLSGEVKQLADWYGQIAYARINPPPQAAGVLQQLWQRLRAT